MRTYSTPQSALKQEITKLAILECIGSIAIYVGIAVYLGTFKYLAAAVVFAPLMLFRTDTSAEWGLKVYKQVSQTLTGTKFLSRLPTPIEVGIEAFLVAMAGTAIRIAATVYWAVRRPLQTIGEVPQNWMRQCLCTDFAHPPEVVPLEAAKGSDIGLSFSEFVETFRDEEATGFRIVFILIFLPFIVIGWLPSIIYRVSFKATALAYIPFIWVAHSTLRNPLSLKSRLQRITKGELEKVRRGFSYLVLTTLVAKLLLIVGWVDRSYLESKFPSQKFVTSIVSLESWPWWQATLAADALLTFFLLYFADAALARLEGQEKWRDERVRKTIAAGTFLRATLSIVTIFHFFYIALLATAPKSLVQLITT